MLTFPRTTTAREIQRNYKKLFDYVKRTKKPILVMHNNKPHVAIIDIKKLEKIEELEAINVVLKSREEIKAGKAKKLTSLVDLWHEAQGN